MALIGLKIRIGFGLARLRRLQLMIEPYFNLLSQVTHITQVVIFSHLFYLHTEHEDRSLSLACRLAFDSAVKIFHYLLANEEAHANTLTINWLLRQVFLIELAKKREQLFHLSFTYSFSIVRYMNDQFLTIRIVTRLNFDPLLVGKLECIFCQVDQHLLEACLITYELVWELTR